MPKAKGNEIPLTAVNELSYLNDGPVVFSHRQRGFLRDIVVTDGKETLHKPVFRLDGKKALLALTVRLREHLDAKELPTDKWPVMPKELDYGYVPEEHGIVADEDLWFEIAEASTEPLSEDRLAAELLHASNRVLARFSDDEKSDIFRAMHLYHLHSMVVGNLNELAVTGASSNKGRAKGPQAKKEKAQALRKLILTIAQEFWTRHPKFEGQPFNTAKKIIDAVNKERAKHSPGCAGVAVSTISHHLSRALEEADL